MYRQGVRHAEVLAVSEGVLPDADHPQAGLVLGKAIVFGAEDTPLDVLSHGLQLAKPGLPPPPASSVCSHLVILFHGEGQGAVAINGCQDLVKQRGPVIGFPPSYCLSGPGLARGARDVQSNRKGLGRACVSCLHI